MSRVGLNLERWIEGAQVDRSFSMDRFSCRFPICFTFSVFTVRFTVSPVGLSLLLFDWFNPAARGPGVGI